MRQTPLIVKPLLSDTDTDVTLVAALRDSDHRAFEIIYRQHARLLYGFVRKNIALKEDCEEIVQEIFESLWARRESLNIQAPLRAYLLGMARYKIIHYIRKKVRVRKYAEHFQLFEALWIQADDKSITHATLQSVLDKLIGQLPARCQEALRLRLSENLSNHEIARRMNIATRTVESYMLHAFQHIRAGYKSSLNH